MPYLTQENRDDLQNRGMETAGEVNYCVCRIINDYFMIRGLCYASINTVLATFDLLREIQKLELLFGINTAKTQMIHIKAEMLEDPSLFNVLMDLLEGFKSNTIAFDSLGAINGAEYEIKRRIIAPYEDMKCFINGEVFDSELLAQACRIPKEEKNES